MGLTNQLQVCTLRFETHFVLKPAMLPDTPEYGRVRNCSRTVRDPRAMYARPSPTFTDAVVVVWKSAGGT